MGFIFLLGSFQVLVTSSPKPSGGFLEEVQQCTAYRFISGNSFGCQSLKPDPSNEEKCKTTYNGHFISFLTTCFSKEKMHLKL